MTDDFLQEQQRAVETAEAVLSRGWQTPVSLTDVVALGDADRRNLILRALACRDGTPSCSVIVKATRDAAFDPTAADLFETSGLAKEWAAAAFLTDRAPTAGHMPAFLGGSAAHGVLVFEDLGAGLGSLVDPLLKGPADRAVAALTAYATALGRLHADTLGRAADHARALQSAFPAATPPDPGGGESWRQQTVARMERLLGGPPIPPSIIDEIAVVGERLARPGAWFGLVHRDACPDNVLLREGRAHLLDFEFASPGHVLIDASYWRMGFPSCWCAGRLPAPVLATMDHAYREALGRALPLARDDRAFREEMAIAQFARLFGSLAWLLDKALAEDRPWGISTHRRRILWYLDAAAEGAQQAGVLGGLADTVRRWREDLGMRWPETEPLALYPAFTP